MERQGPTAARKKPPLGWPVVADEEGQEDEGPLFAWLPPEDRLWRHPSEVGADGPAPVPRPRPSWPATHVWTVALAAGLVGALLTSALLVVTGSLFPRATTRVIEGTETPTSLLTNQTDPPGGAAQTWPQVAKALAPSVVAVTSSVGGSGGQTGSGVIFETGAGTTDIITSKDLLQSGGSVQVQFNDGRSLPAHLVGTDQATDIAVLSVPVKDGNLPYWGTVANLSDAQSVLAMGASTASDGGYVQGTVTGLDQAVPDQNDSMLVGMVAISGGPVPSGTDGGAVVDQAGEVVGIDTASAATSSSSQSVTYAVPVDQAMRVANQIISKRQPTHPWLGIEASTDVTQAKGGPAGALVTQVYPGTPAWSAGLRPDDIITSIAGQRVTSSAMVTSVVANMRVGRRVAVSFQKGQVQFRRVLVVTNQPPVLSINPS